MPAHVYTQVPAFAAADRGMLDLLSVDKDGRLAVIELKADEDLHLALQGLDYWVRVRWHHRQNPDAASGLGEFQRHGYFGGVRLAEGDPRLYLVAPALRVHPATDVVLRYLSPRVDWVLVALDERWRRQIKVVWRKRSGDVTKSLSERMVRAGLSSRRRRRRWGRLRRAGLPARAGWRGWRRRIRRRRGRRGRSGPRRWLGGGVEPLGTPWVNQAANCFILPTASRWRGL